MRISRIRSFRLSPKINFYFPKKTPSVYLNLLDPAHRLMIFKFKGNILREQFENQ